MQETVGASAGAVSLFLAAVLSACTTQGSFRELGTSYPPKPGNCEIEIFKGSDPGKPYIRISKINVHLEKTHFVHSDLSSASKELKRQACLSGADALIELSESSSGYLETRMYNVTATGIVFQTRSADH
ncbi:MAG: hypothetical protein ISP90_01300 [Nevskia sp.]|nr:hypothetical protein [Nevskia sp.]